MVRVFAKTGERFRNGATAGASCEYALLLALVVVALIASLVTLSGDMNGKFAGVQVTSPSAPHGPKAPADALDFLPSDPMDS
jgi:Flp pilus assembly pilin Flp